MTIINGFCIIIITQKVGDTINILSFLTPKSEVTCVKESFSLRQTMEKMENCFFSAVPVLDDNERYVGTLTEGDILWYLKKNSFPSIYDAERIPMTAVERRTVVNAVNANTRAEELMNASLNQNFVPVTDDRGVFIGLVTRQRLIRYLLDKTGNTF